MADGVGIGGMRLQVNRTATSREHRWQKKGIGMGLESEYG